MVKSEPITLTCMSSINYTSRYFSAIASEADLLPADSNCPPGTVQATSLPSASPSTAAGERPSLGS